MEAWEEDAAALDASLLDFDVDELLSSDLRPHTPVNAAVVPATSPIRMFDRRGRMVAGAINWPAIQTLLQQALDLETTQADVDLQLWNMFGNPDAEARVLDRNHEDDINMHADSLPDPDLTMSQVTAQLAFKSSLDDEDRYETALENFLTFVKDRSRSSGIATHVMQQKNASYCPYPEVPAGPGRSMINYFESQFDELFVHQQESFAAFCALTLFNQRHSVFLTTPTASGKSVAYCLPVLYSLAVDPSSRAIFVFPLNALVHDQAANLQRWLDDLKNVPGQTFGDVLLLTGESLSDTPAVSDEASIHTARIIITNPEKLHVLLQCSRAFNERFVPHLKFVVCDEIHVYQGHFGSNVSLLLRRLQMAVSQPIQFFFSSATISYPEQFVRQMVYNAEGQLPFHFISSDRCSAPVHKKTICCLARPTDTALMEFFDGIIQSRKLSCIMFCRSIDRIESLFKGLVDRYPEVATTACSLIRRYYAAIGSAAEKRSLVSEFNSGETRIMLATNAVEAGVDFSSADICILDGVPSADSFKQRIGRVGRKRQSMVLILPGLNSPFDRWVSLNFDDFLQQAFSDDRAPILLNGVQNVYLLARHYSYLQSSMYRFSPSRIIQFLEMTPLQQSWIFSIAQAPDQSCALVDFRSSISLPYSIVLEDGSEIDSANLDDALRKYPVGSTFSLSTGRYSTQAFHEVSSIDIHARIITLRRLNPELTIDAARIAQQKTVAIKSTVLTDVVFDDKADAVGTCFVQLAQGEDMTFDMRLELRPCTVRKTLTDKLVVSKKGLPEAMMMSAKFDVHVNAAPELPTVACSPTCFEQGAAPGSSAPGISAGPSVIEQSAVEESEESKRVVTDVDPEQRLLVAEMKTFGLRLSMSDELCALFERYRADVIQKRIDDAHQSSKDAKSMAQIRWSSRQDPKALFEMCVMMELLHFCTVHKGASCEALALTTVKNADGSATYAITEMTENGNGFLNLAVQPRIIEEFLHHASREFLLYSSYNRFHSSSTRSVATVIDKCDPAFGSAFLCRTFTRCEASLNVSSRHETSASLAVCARALDLTPFADELVEFPLTFPRPQSSSQVDNGENASSARGRSLSPKKARSAPKRLRASDAGQFVALGCDRFMWFALHGVQDPTQLTRNEAQEHVDAMLSRLFAGDATMSTQFQQRQLMDRGNVWEASLVHKLSQEDFVLPGFGSFEFLDLKMDIDELRTMASRTQPFLDALDRSVAERKRMVVYQPCLDPTDILDGPLQSGAEMNYMLPDFILLDPFPADNSGCGRITIVDAKFSDRVKPSHQMQIGLYDYILDKLLKDPSQHYQGKWALADHCGVWLRNRESFDIVQLTSARARVRQFLGGTVPHLCQTDIEDIHWAIEDRCRKCNYYSLCRGEAERARDISLLPSVGLKEKVAIFEKSEMLPQPVRKPNIDQLAALFASTTLRQQVSRAVPTVAVIEADLAAMRHGEPILYGSKYPGMYQRSNFKVYIKVFSRGPTVVEADSDDDPISSFMYWGVSVHASYSTPSFVADADHRKKFDMTLSFSYDDRSRQCDDALFDCLHKLLQMIDEVNHNMGGDRLNVKSKNGHQSPHNGTRSNAKMKKCYTVQFFVLDQHERRLVSSALSSRIMDVSAAISRETDVVTKATLMRKHIKYMQLAHTLFPDLQWIQSARLAATDPSVVSDACGLVPLLHAIRATVATGVEIVNIRDALVALQPRLATLRYVRVAQDDDSARLEVEIRMALEEAARDPRLVRLPGEIHALVHKLCGSIHQVFLQFSALVDYCFARKLQEDAHFHHYLQQLPPSVQDTGSQVDKLRSLFMSVWPPHDFAWPVINHAWGSELSRQLLFVRQWEQLTAWTDTRSSRFEQRAVRLARRSAVRVRYLSMDAEVGRAKRAPYCVFQLLDCEAPPSWMKSLLHGTEGGRPGFMEYLLVGDDNALADLQPGTLALRMLFDCAVDVGNPSHVNFVRKQAMGVPVFAARPLQRLDTTNMQFVIELIGFKRGDLQEGQEFLMQELATDSNAPKVYLALEKISYDNLLRWVCQAGTAYLGESSGVPQVISLNADFYRLQRDRPDHPDSYWAFLNTNECATLRPTDTQCRALKSFCNSRLSLILGPPGTGKTQMLAFLLLTVCLGYRRSGARHNAPKILVTASTRAAIYNVLDRLNRLCVALGSNPPDIAVLVNLLDDGGSWKPNNIDDSKPLIVFGTLWKVAKTLQGKRIFNLLIVDEASQMLVPDCAVALAAMDPAVSVKVVFAGDHHQLPPILRGDYPRLQPHVTSSIFECVQAGLEGHPDMQQLMLTQLNENFRFGEKLCVIPRMFYNDEYAPVERHSNRTLQLLESAPLAPAPVDPALPIELTSLLHEVSMPNNPPFIVIRVRYGALLLTEDELCRREAKLVVNIMKSLQARFRLGLAGARPFFVVTPHHVQRNAVLSAVQGQFPRASNLATIDTAERMQGQECDVGIICFGIFRRNLIEARESFVYDYRRMNVAATRARCMNIVILSEDLESGLPSTTVSSTGYALLQRMITQHYVESGEPVNKLLEIDIQHLM